MQQAAHLFYDPPVLQHYDLLGFDPRGVARSDPATCFRTAAEEAATTLLDMVYPLTGRQEFQFVGEAFEAAVRCQATSLARFATGSSSAPSRRCYRCCCLASLNARNDRLTAVTASKPC